MIDNMMKIKPLIIAATLLASPHITFADTNKDAEKIATRGNGKGATACVACHGQKGEGNAAVGYPYLAGLPVDYFKKQIDAFKQGTRQNKIMQPIAKSLDETEIAALAGYYSSLANQKISMKLPVETKQHQRGMQLATRGKWQVGMPSCFKCHGDGGRGIPPHFPPISGQPYQYIKNQLDAFQNRTRKNDSV
jgi:thiosulfate dehydrogenase